MTNPVCGDCKYFWTPWCPKHGCMTSSPYDKESWKKDQQCKPCYDALANTNYIVDLRNHYDAAIKERDEAREERDAAIKERDNWKENFDAELRGAAKLRREHGARDDETFFSFVARLRAERDAAIKERDVAIGERDGARHELLGPGGHLHRACAERDSALARAEKAESDRDAALSALATERSKSNKPTPLERIASIVLSMNPGAGPYRIGKGIGSAKPWIGPRRESRGWRSRKHDNRKDGKMKKQKEEKFVLKEGSPEDDRSHPFKIGQAYLIRLVTHYWVGILEWVGPTEMVLKDASWIADTGRFHEAIETGKMSETEYVGKSGSVIIGRGALVDAVLWEHKLPTESK